jgi:hypothetical protein
MRRVTGFVIVLSVLAVTALPPASHTVAEAYTDLTSQYIWRPMKIGGAGWETDCWIHPTEPNLVYSKTDVGGCYRWDPVKAEWVQIVTGDSMPEPPGGYFGNECCGPAYPGVLSIVGAPSDPDVAYLFAGSGDRLPPYNGQVYRSTNRGDTWTLPGNLDVHINANDEERTAGPHLAVDPADANIVYVGTQQDGLWVSFDGAATFSQVTAVPAGGTGGVGNVDFDPSSGTTGGRTNTIYASVFGSGVYASFDAGASWSSIGGSTGVNDMEVGSDGTLFIADGTIDKYSGGSWTQINSDGNDIAVDPNDPNHLYAIGTHGGLGAGKVSWDQGVNWTGLTRKTTSDIPWQQAYFPEAAATWMSCGQIVFDPFVPDRLWYSEGFGCWRADNLGDQGLVHWHSISQGLEDLCGHTLVWPPGGNPITGGMDLGVFYHDDPNAYTAARVTPEVFLNGWGMDYCPAQPSFVACIQTHAQDDYSSYSNDGGNTWTEFAGKPAANKDTPTGLAVSATDPNNIVVYDASKNNAYVTANGGGSWTSKSLGTPFIASWGPGDNAIAADRVDAGTFYVYNWSDDANGGIWNSTDGGNTWNHVHQSSYGGGNSLYPTCYGDIEATPTRAGHVWFCGGIVGDNSTHGLYRSTDYGATWTLVPGTDFALSVGFGKADDGATYPTIFYYGKLDGVDGVWRSTDECQTWAKVCTGGPLGIYSGSMVAMGDPDQFGKVAFAIDGKGFAYGDIIDTTAPAAPTNLSAVAVTSSKIELDWDDAPEPDLHHYNVYRKSGGGSYALVASARPDSDYTDMHLLAETTYDYVVTAIDDQDNESADSNQASATTPCCCSGTTTHVADIDVSTESRGDKGQKHEKIGVAEVWIVDTCGDPVADATVYGTFSGTINETGYGTTDADGYTVIRTSAWASTPSITFCVDDVVHATMPYAPGDNVVSCCDLNDNCTGPGDTTPPAAPTNLDATAVGPSRIDLDWDDNSEPDLDSYNVYRDTVQIASDVSQSQYSDETCSPNTTYCYTVTAVDTSENESDHSNQDCATTPDAGPTMHVDSITVTIVPVAGPRSKAVAEVVILDEFGAPVENATVSGTFTGDISDSGSDDTDQNGLAVIESGAANNVTSVTFCVDGVTHATLTYAPGDNVETCDSN